MPSPDVYRLSAAQMLFTLTEKSAVEEGERNLDFRAENAEKFNWCLVTPIDLRKIVSRYDFRD
jgi:hypothetical protein